MEGAALDDDMSPADRNMTGWSAAGAGGLAANLMQRILLVADGTVTNILEAYAGEPITVVKLRQVTEPAAHALGDLEVRASDDVMLREVLLTGRRSGRTLIYALSRIVPTRLDPAVRRGLVGSHKPIGRLIDENRIETFREILAARREPAGARGIHFGIGRDAAMLSRTYRIIAGGRPIMIITEKFPADAFGDAA